MPGRGVYRDWDAEPSSGSSIATASPTKLRSGAPDPAFGLAELTIRQWGEIEHHLGGTLPEQTHRPARRLCRHSEKASVAGPWIT